MPVLYILFAFSDLLEKANTYLLPCPFKYLTGYDCPGCGFQRAVLALLKGDFYQSLQIYPPAIPIIATVTISLAANFWWGSRSKVMINTLFILTGLIIAINYGYKLFGLFIS